ncbi:MAG TPA: FimV/HubP family polar landmark protein [Steroidobacter sp.]|uniref:FimV/HubP family polar landmark protein n=1 Tax=Steroidobacter sp. TaxID=1978227 RepID=UPI002EDB40EA
MRRHLPRLLLTGALLSPVTLYALGLGEIRLNSALNQPFDAEIELLSPTAEELGSLKVTLASNDVFSRYGIDRPSYLNNFDFSVSRGRDGKATIKVTSNRSVTEPYVTLLVEASWARGRLVREYTVLLDPPVFMPSQNETAPAPVTTPQSATTAEGRIERRPTPAPEPAPVPAPATPRATPTPEPTPAPSQAQRTEEPTASDQVIASPGSEYTVQRNDTLSKIASAANPGPRRVNNQTMIALFRANPQAFSGNNINRLRAGSVLRIPELSEIEAISADEAGAEVSRQVAEWSGGVVADTTPESDRLRLVTPQETPTPPTPAQAPQQQAQQQPQPSASPGTPSTPDRRLEVENPGLAQAQQNVDPTPAQPPVEPMPSEEVVTPTDSQATEPAPATEEPVAPAAEAQPQTPPKATPAPTPEPSLLDTLKDYAWVALIALGLLIVLGVAFVRRRREAEEDSLDSLSMPMDFEPPSERPARALAPSSKGGRADAFLVEGEDDAGLVKTNLDEDLDFDAPEPTKRREPSRGFEPAAAAPAARGVEDTMSSESAVRFDQQDALAEADFHMAYGLYDQAADLVKIAIDREPSRRDLKLKLLEIYFVWGNKDLFLDTARDLYETRGEAAQGEWDKVAIMGKQIAPDDSMFKGEGGHVDLVDVNLEGGENRVDVDLFAEPSDDRQALDLEFASGERRGPNDATQVSNDLDFLLDEPNDDDTQEQRTREVDQLARTQETPTIESPMIDRTVQTVREKVDTALFSKTGSTGDTAELSIDDLGLDVNSIDQGQALEDTTSIEKDLGDVRPLRDDEMTQLAPSLSSFDRTMEAPRVSRFDGDIESTGTIYIDQVDLAAAAGDTAEHRRPDVDSTASMKKPLAMTDIDLDLDNLSSERVSSDTVRRPREEEDIFSGDVFGERTQDVTRGGGIDLDVGDPLAGEDNEPTQRQSLTTEMELSELEPVTMSEVGTKLDLARAYMDMGDPDGARSILEEVLGEGNPNQKQEAQRLMDSIR